MKNIKFLILAMLVMGCSSREIISRKDGLVNKQKITNEILKESKTITLNEAINIAIARNLTLKTREIEENISHIDKTISFGNFLPRINMAYSRTVLQEPLKARVVDSNLDEVPKNIEKKMPIVAPIINNISKGLASVMPSSIESRILDKDFQNIVVSAELPIFVPATWFLYSARSKGEDIASLTRKLTEQMIKLHTISQYYYILALKSEETHLQTEVKSTETLKNNSILALKTGSILPWEAKKIDVFNEVKHHALSQNGRDMQLAKVKFLNSLDLYPFFDIHLIKPKTQDFAHITLHEAIYEALRKNKLITIREKAIGVSQDLTKIAITNFLPKIVLSANFVNTNVETLVNHNFFMGTLGGLFSIFNGFKNVNEYRKARENEKIAFIKREQAITKVIAQTVMAYNEYESSYEEMKIANANYEANLGMYHQKKLQKEIGDIDDYEYLKALGEYENSVSLKEKALYKYRVTRAVLDMLMEKSIFADKEGESNEK